MKILGAVLLMAVCGCVTFRVAPDSKELTVWHIVYDRPDPRPEGGGSVFLVRDFACSPGFDRTDMVLVDSSGRLDWNPAHRWSARPASLLSDMLAADMLADRTAAGVFREPSTVIPDYLVDGYVMEFGARESDSGWQAVLELTVSVFAGQSSRPMYQEHYSYVREMDELSPSEMAEAMSALVKMWSADTRDALLPGTGRR